MNNFRRQTQNIDGIKAKKLETFAPMHVPKGAIGTAYYARNHPHTMPWIISLLPYVLSVLDDLEINPDRPFVTCDYGCADGANSVPLVISIIGYIRKKFPNLPIFVGHEDRHENDFTSLFTLVQGFMSGRSGYMENFDKVYPIATGVNFYKQCFPDSWVDLAFCSSSVHWLSKRPCVLKEALKHTDQFVSEREATLFSEQAAMDWSTFLVQRAKEIKTGGKLVMCVMCYDKNLHADRNQKAQNIARLWVEKLKDLIDENIITQEEFENTTFNAYFRNEAELRAPFLEPDSAVLRAGLRLKSVNMKLFNCPIHKKWMDAVSSGTISDNKAARMHAKMFIRAMKVFFQSTFTGGLSESRTTEEKHSIVENYYSRVEAELATNPADYAIDVIVGYLVIEKTLSLCQ